MIIGCYSMHLYCDTGNATPGMPGDGGTSPHDHSDAGFAEFTAQTLGECKAQARKLGWHFMRDKRVICPRCAGYGIGNNDAVGRSTSLR